MRRGLQPTHPDTTRHDWVWDLSGRSRDGAVFLSTSPVAGKGGDPVSFAMGWPVSQRIGHYPGYIVVVDLPPAALDLAQAVVPNIELNTFISVSSTRDFLRQTVQLEANAPLDTERRKALATWRLSHWCLHYWLARYCADYGIPLTTEALAEYLTLRAERIDPALPRDLTPARWQAFLDDYFRVVAFAYRDSRSEAERERRRHSILRKHGISLPAEFEDDWHCKTCLLCIRGLASWAYYFDGFPDYAPMREFLAAQPKKSGFQRLSEMTRVDPYVIPAPVSAGGIGSLQPLAMRLRAVLAHTEPFPSEHVTRYFRERECSDKTPREASWTWEQWYAEFPAERCALPHAWQPGYCRRFSASDLTRPDCQVIAAAIPAAYLLGAIKISDGARLVPRLRPHRRRGETLASKLWMLTHELRARYAGTSIVLD